MTLQFLYEQLLRLVESVRNLAGDLKEQNTRIDHLEDDFDDLKQRLDDRDREERAEHKQDDRDTRAERFDGKQTFVLAIVGFAGSVVGALASIIAAKITEAQTAVHSITHHP